MNRVELQHILTCNSGSFKTSTSILGGLGHGRFTTQPDVSVGINRVKHRCRNTENAIISRCRRRFHQPSAAWLLTVPDRHFRKP